MEFAQLPQFSLANGLPTSALKRQTDPVTPRKFHTPEEETTTPLEFFVRGEPYCFLGLIPYARDYDHIDGTGFQLLGRWTARRFRSLRLALT